MRCWGPCAAMLVFAGCDYVLRLDEVKPVTPGGDGGNQPIDAALRPDGEPMGCPADYDIIVQTTASRYRLVTETATWTNAVADCASDARGLTHLLVLSNEAERTAFITNPPSYLLDDTWIGAADTITNNLTFQWVTSENTNGYVVPAALGASPWEPDQPDATGSCAELRALSGSLHDETCDSSANYICECDGYADDPNRY